MNQVVQWTVNIKESNHKDKDLFYPSRSRQNVQ